MPPSTFFISSLLVLISTSISPVRCTNPNTTFNSVEIACSNATVYIDTDLCLRVLQPIPKVASATDLYNLTIAIIESGTSNATDTLKYIESVLFHYQATDARSEAKNAFVTCKEMYALIVTRFSKALQEVKDSYADYYKTSYELQSASTDCVRICGMFLFESRVEDEVVSRGNEIVTVYGTSAMWTLRLLHAHSPPAPNPNA